MRRRPLLLVLGITLASSLVAVVGLAWRADAAADAEARARALLAAPFEDAPELGDLDAVAAMDACDESTERGAEGLEGLRAYAEAITFLEAGDLISAEGAMTVARHRSGWTVDLHVLAAAIERGRMNNAEAERHINEALSRDPDHLRGLLLHADLALDANDGRAALMALGRLIEEAPSMATLHNRRGLALEAADELDSAREAFERASSLDDTLAEAAINLGRLFRRDGDVDAAREQFTRATELAVGDSDAWLGLALCAMELDDLDGAMQGFERATELAPHDVSGRVGLADVAMRRGDRAQALEHYRAALREAPHQAGLWVKLGNTLVGARDLPGAEEAFRQAIRHAPRLAAAHNGLGATLMQRGRDEDAAASLQRAAELDPADPHPLMNLALMRERGGDASGARDAWREALRRDPDSRIARAHLGS